MIHFTSEIILFFDASITTANRNVAAKKLPPNKLPIAILLSDDSESVVRITVRMSVAPFAREMRVAPATASDSLRWRDSLAMALETNSSQTYPMIRNWMTIMKAYESMVDTRIGIAR